MLSELRASTNGEPVTLVTDVNTAAAPLGVHCWCKSANQHQRSPCAVQQKRAPNRLDTASREASARRRRSPSPTSTWAILLCSSSDLRPTKRMKSVSPISRRCVRRPMSSPSRCAVRGGGAADTPHSTETTVALITVLSCSWVVAGGLRAIHERVRHRQRAHSAPPCCTDKSHAIIYNSCVDSIGTDVSSLSF